MQCFDTDTRLQQKEALSVGLAKAVSRSLRPPPKLFIDEWADKHRFLSSESASEPGRWKTNRVAVARGVMRAANAPGTRVLTFVAGTQIAKTELLLNILGYYIHLDPAPILIVQPSEMMCMEFSKQRLASMIRSSPVLREIFSKKVDAENMSEEGAEKSGSRAKDSSNTILSKSFSGGHLAIASASSPSQLASRPIRITLADEVDRYEESAGSEGDPLGIAEKRTGNFPSNSLCVRVSSPTDAPAGPGKPGSRIWRSYLSSDQRKPYVPCPHCNHKQVLKMGDRDSMGGIKWTAGFPDTAAYFCVGCGAAWTESDRLDALQKVEWRQTKKFTWGGIEQDPVENDLWKWDEDQHCMLAVCKVTGETPISTRHAGFWASRLYSPFQDMASVAREFLDVRKDPHRLKQFVNTVLAELWDEPAEEVKYGDMLARRENYPAEVPDFVHTLVGGVDTQDGRLEIKILGIGKDDELAVIDHVQFFGETSEKEVWDELDRFTLKTWERRDGLKFSLQAVAVDTQGHRTQFVYDFCRERVGRRFFAIRGKPEAGNKRSPIWPARAIMLKSRGRVPLYEIGTQSAKYFLKALLTTKTPGPRYVHFPSHLESQYFEQLQAERLVTKFHNGAVYSMWECPPGKRNEAWDCFVYAYAAWQGLVSANFRPVYIPLGNVKKEDEEEKPKESNEVVVVENNRHPALIKKEDPKENNIKDNKKTIVIRDKKVRKNNWLGSDSRGSSWFGR